MDASNCSGLWTSSPLAVVTSPYILGRCQYLRCDVVFCVEEKALELGMRSLLLLHSSWGEGFSPGRLHSSWQVQGIFSMRGARGNPPPMHKVDWDLYSMWASAGREGAWWKGGCRRRLQQHPRHTVSVSLWEAERGCGWGSGWKRLQGATTPPAALSLGCAGEQGFPERALFVPWPASLLLTGTAGKLSAWLPAGTSVLTRVTLFGEPIGENGKFGESLLGEILIFGERERYGCLTGNVSA